MTPDWLAVAILTVLLANLLWLWSLRGFLRMPRLIRCQMAHWRTWRCARSERCRCDYVLLEACRAFAYCKTHDTVRLLTAEETRKLSVYVGRQKEGK